MFGHQDDQNHHHHDGDHQPMENVLSDPAVDTVLNTDDNSFNPALPSSDDSPFGDAPAHDDQQDVSAPVVPDEPVADEPAAPVVVAPSDDLVTPTGDDNNDLLSIKQQALTELSPLVGHLEQTPEEKFRTTMMMIQASDNQSLIKTAYEAAQAIEDEKVKAQALLDIVNEINYFTQHAA
jgi:hypothetical protein